MHMRKIRKVSRNSASRANTKRQVKKRERDRETKRERQRSDRRQTAAAKDKKEKTGDGTQRKEVPVGFVEDDDLVAPRREIYRLARESFDGLAHDIDAPMHRKK